MTSPGYKLLSKYYQYDLAASALTHVFYYSYIDHMLIALVCMYPTLCYILGEFIKSVLHSKSSSSNQAWPCLVCPLPWNFSLNYEN